MLAVRVDTTYHVHTRTVRCKKRRADRAELIERSADANRYVTLKIQNTNDHKVFPSKSLLQQQTSQQTQQTQKAIFAKKTIIIH